MSLRPARLLALSALCAASLPAQAPVLDATPAVTGTGPVVTQLSGAANRAFVTLLDIDGAPTTLLGQDLFLGFSPALTVLDAGVLDAQGQRRQSYKVPAAWLSAQHLYLQAAVADPGSPAGFALSDGESIVNYRGFPGTLMVETFDNAAAAGFHGTFDNTYRGRLMAGEVTRRLQEFPTIAANPRPLAFPLVGELSEKGIRAQRVYRRQDLGGQGVEETLTGMWFESFEKVTVFRHDMQRVVVDISHSTVVPDFSIDPLTAFPAFPKSGLSRTFSDNAVPGTTVRVHDGPMRIDPQALRRYKSRLFVPYPLTGGGFDYDGTRSLLIDVQHYQDTAPARNGQQAYFQVTSSPRPDARVLSGPSADPQKEVQAQRGDNVMVGMLFEFSRLKTVAYSTWRPAPKASPDYQSPSLGASIPAGASLRVLFQGADSVQGANPTALSTDINVADGRAYLRYVVEFRARKDGARPSLDTLIIPVR